MPLPSFSLESTILSVSSAIRRSYSAFINFISSSEMLFVKKASSTPFFFSFSCVRSFSNFSMALWSLLWESWIASNTIRVMSSITISLSICNMFTDRRTISIPTSSRIWYPTSHPAKCPTGSRCRLPSATAVPHRHALYLLPSFRSRVRETKLFPHTLHWILPDSG